MARPTTLSAVETPDEAPEPLASTSGLSMAPLATPDELPNSLSTEICDQSSSDGSEVDEYVVEPDTKVTIEDEDRDEADDDVPPSFVSESEIILNRDSRDFDEDSNTRNESSPEDEPTIDDNECEETITLNASPFFEETDDNTTTDLPEQQSDSEQLSDRLLAEESDRLSPDQTTSDTTAEDCVQSSTGSQPKPCPRTTFESMPVPTDSGALGSEAQETSHRRLERVGHHNNHRRTVSIGPTLSSVHSSLRESSTQPVNRSSTITWLPSIPERTVRYQRIDIEGPLPANWESQIDAHGRVFYIDHLNRTTWTRPQVGQHQTVEHRNQNSQNNESIQRQQLDRRYQSIRRTMTGRGSRDFHNNHNHTKSSAQTPTAPDNNQLSPTDATDGPCLSTQASTPPAIEPPVTNDQLSSASQTTTTTTTTTTSASTPTPTQTSSVPTQSCVILDLPAMRFIMRTDFFNLVHMNDEALAQYNSSSSLKHMVTKIRREGQHSVTAAFERYQHNRDLVSLLNKFAETSRELPSGWESKIDRSGKQFFIDHSSRSTTFVDPRLPLDVPVVNPHKLVLAPSRRRVRNNYDYGHRTDH